MTTPAEPDPPREPDASSDAASSVPDGTDEPGWHRDRPTSRPGMVRIRKRRTSQRRLRKRRRVGIVMLAVGGLIVLTGAWIAITALMARSELNAVRDQLGTLRRQIDAGQLDQARKTANLLAEHARDAHDLTTGPFWASASVLPGAQPLRTVRQITTQAAVLAEDVLPRLVTATDGLDPARLRGADGSIDVARIQRVAPALDAAYAATERATGAIADEPADSGLGVVDSARANLLDQLRGLTSTLRSADLASRIAPEVLGADGVKRYFITFQNNAEARGTGGLPGAFGILRADRGRVSFERFESDDTLVGTPSGLDFGAEYEQLFGGLRTTSEYRNANISPNFPYAARVWIAQWKVKTGERLDGAMAIDPEALSYLLQAAGPATLPDGTKVTAQNVVALTQRDVYRRFAGREPARKAFLLRLAKQVSEHVVDSKASPTALVKAGARAAGERRLLLYNADPAVQRDVAKTSLAGIVPRTSAPYAGLSIVNDGGNKLDYYLDRSLTWFRTGCGDRRNVTATIRLHNGAPTGLPRYVTSRTDVRDYRVRPGDSRIKISYYATEGARLSSAYLGGKKVITKTGRQFGHPVYTIDIELPRSFTQTLVLRMTEPKGNGSPQVLRQPLVRPLQTSIVDGSC